MNQNNLQTPVNEVKKKYFQELRIFFQNKSYSLPIKLIFALLVITFIILAITFRKLPPVTPLFYSLPWGEEQLVRKSQLFLIPFSITMVFILNLILGITFFKKDDFLIRVLLWGALFVSLLGLITLTKIILLVI